MYLAIICDSNVNKPIGVVGISKDQIGFLTNNDDLNNVLEYIVNKDDIFLSHYEIVNNNKILCLDKINIDHENYLIGINYILPYPWRIMGLTNVDNDEKFNDNIESFYNMLNNKEVIHE